MKVFGISDLHLTKSRPEKSMDRFGPEWHNHEERLATQWISRISSRDIVVIAGDTSWANDIKDSKKDFEFLSQLPGRKIVGVGNHDYWWQSQTYSNNKFAEWGMKDIYALRNSSVILDGVQMCSVKGYMLDTSPMYSEEVNGKNRRRELNRLNITLNNLDPNYQGKTILAIHHPPMLTDNVDSDVRKMITESVVSHCIYGHMHQDGAKLVVEGDFDGVNYAFVAADRKSMIPHLIMEVEELE